MDRIDWSIVLLKFNELEMTRIAIGLRLWLRRAIKRINHRTTARIVDMVNWNSLRALCREGDMHAQTRLETGWVCTR